MALIRAFYSHTPPAVRVSFGAAREMRELALFAGAGGGLWASRLLGWRTVCAVEVDPFRREVLRARQRDGVFEPFEIHDDVRTFDAERWRGRIDVVSGGFPCQGWSLAGKRLGERDHRNLWPETAGIVARVRPQWVFFENVAALAGADYFHEVILGELEALGFAIAWARLRASSVGAKHRRARLWIVGCRAADSGIFELRLERRRRKSRSRASRARADGATESLADTGQAARRAWSEEQQARWIDLLRSGRVQATARARSGGHSLADSEGARLEGPGDRSGEASLGSRQGDEPRSSGVPLPNADSTRRGRKWRDRLFDREWAPYGDDADGCDLPWTFDPAEAPSRWYTVAQPDLGYLVDGLASRRGLTITDGEIVVPRVATGVHARRKQLAALGDGQVPLQAATAWRLLAGRIGLT